MKLRPRVEIFSGRFDLVPLVNVIFLLLIFFMISSSLVFQPGIPVELPPSFDSSMRFTDKLVVTLSKSDLLFFNDSPVQWDEMERQLRDLVLNTRLEQTKRSGRQAAGGGDAPRQRLPMIVIRADTSVPYGKIVEVMSLARSLNVGVFLATDFQKNSRPPSREKPRGEFE